MVKNINDVSFLTGPLAGWYSPNLIATCGGFDLRLDLTFV